jgi:hypothetical protein
MNDAATRNKRARAFADTLLVRPRLWSHPLGLKETLQSNYKQFQQTSGDGLIREIKAAT